MSVHEEIKPRAESAVMEQSRATPLLPSFFMTAVLVFATVTALFLRVPTWAGIFLCSLTGLSFLFYLVSYIYLMLYDREALRRERLRVVGRQGLERGSLAPTNTGLISDRPQRVLATQPINDQHEAVVRRSDA